jgi:signal transduction histidine kinase
MENQTEPKTPSAAAPEGEMRFRPRARIIQTIGRDLISNQVIAIQELIKNAYDADADEVHITFEPPLEIGKGAVIISDNGDGMTMSDIRGGWMEPATPSKVTRTHSGKGRRVTGEKGIGRFAAARVGRFLDIVTRPKNGNSEISVSFDWSLFADPSKYLDEISCTIQTVDSSPEAPKGTQLRISGLNDNWEEDAEKGVHSFSDLKAELSRLVAPLDKDEFKIFLSLPPQYLPLEGEITPPDVLGKPHYKLCGSMDGAGQVDASYEGPQGVSFLLDEKGARPKVLIGGKPPRCGSFKFELRVWDRANEDLEPLAKELGSTIRAIKRDLDAASGISIYRDNFRVLVPEGDWLRLDLRRVQNPTMRVSNNQVVGRIFISADRNKALKDQTNRQGIVDSPEFDDFKIAVKEILSKLEIRRELHRRNRPTDSRSGLFEKLEFAPVKTYLLNRYPGDLQLSGLLDVTERRFESGISDVQNVLSRYRRLATLGQLIDMVLHEGRTPISAIRNEVELMSDSVGDSNGLRKEELARHMAAILSQTEVLTVLFRRLSPFSGRKRNRQVPVTVESSLEDVFALHKQRLDEMKVVWGLPNTNHAITADPAELQMIFLNLLENALYWLERIPERDRRIVVTLTSIPGGLQVVFSDSGPGVSEDIRDRIFDPYFSAKPEGVGLGLTIAGEAAAEYGGSLELLASGPLPGATFRVTLKEHESQ